MCKGPRAGGHLTWSPDRQQGLGGGRSREASREEAPAVVLLGEGDSVRDLRKRGHSIRRTCWDQMGGGPCREEQAKCDTPVLACAGGKWLWRSLRWT